MHLAKRTAFAVCLLFFISMVSCVTIHIHFPAAQVERAADSITSRVMDSLEEAPTPDDSSSLDVFTRVLAWFGPAEAHASALTDGLEQELIRNFTRLAPYFDSGNLGLDNRGFIAIRNLDGVSLQDEGTVRSLVEEGNQTRDELYRAVAQDTGADMMHLDRVKEIFASYWQERAKPGWWIQDASGSWRQK